MEVHYPWKATTSSGCEGGREAALGQVRVGRMLMGERQEAHFSFRGDMLTLPCCQPVLPRAQGAQMKDRVKSLEEAEFHGGNMWRCFGLWSQE